MTVVPDKIFALEHLDKPAGQNRRYLFLEIDQGTEPIDTAQSNRASIKKKLLAYGHTRGREIHKQVYGMNTFRVLFVVKGTRAGRITEIIDFYRREREQGGIGYPGLFLFAASRDLLSASNMLSVPWVTAEGKEVGLIEG